MEYIKSTFTIPEEYSDILIAELGEVGYDSFAGEGNLLDGYIPENLFCKESIFDIIEKYKDIFPVSFTWEKMEQKNWNEEWEKNFEPVSVGEKCLVRASFHQPDKKYQYDIVINPKMSFGTGHHDTTALMLENQLLIDHEGKRIMDAGSGTGILAIMAEKLRGEEILAYDIEDWAYQNMIENVHINNCSKIEIKQGTIREINPKGQFDIILANINKNVLLDELPNYVEKLQSSGKILLSGFYSEDIPDLLKKVSTLNLKLDRQSISKNNWACLVFSKK